MSHLVLTVAAWSPRGARYPRRGVEQLRGRRSSCPGSGHLPRGPSRTGEVLRRDEATRRLSRRGRGGGDVLIEGLLLVRIARGGGHHPGVVGQRVAVRDEVGVVAPLLLLLLGGVEILNGVRVGEGRRRVTGCVACRESDPDYYNRRKIENYSQNSPSPGAVVLLRRGGG